MNKAIKYIIFFTAFVLIWAGALSTDPYLNAFVRIAGAFALIWFVAHCLGLKTDEESPI